MSWLWEIIGEIGDVFQSEHVVSAMNRDNVTADELIDEGKQAVLLRALRGKSEGWEVLKDNFGTKVYKSLPWGEGEIRVGLVLTSRGALKIDIREWYSKDV